jgi:HSP20 family protein
MAYDLFEEMRRMQEHMDRMFEESFHGERKMLPGPVQKGGREVAKREFTRSPVCDIRETEKSVLATFELPGADKKDIELNVTEDSVEVKAHRKLEKEVKDDKKGYYSYSSVSSAFYRALPLPARVDANKAVAVYDNGMLRVEIPKLASQTCKSKRIDIR